MYLLYLDESGAHGGSPAYVLGGIAVHEQDVYHVQQRLETMLQAKLPDGFAAADFELHAQEIKSPKQGDPAARPPKPPSPWFQFDYRFRIDLLRGAYSAIGGYSCVNTQYPCAFFGAVVDRHYSDRKRRAYEEVLHRFDEMLGRLSRDGGPHERGIVIHDESTVEKNLQAWTQRWREVTDRIPGTLGHIVDVPFFADSKSSRMIQAADLVTFSLWRFYGLDRSDTTWIDGLWDRFDASDGHMHGLVHVNPRFRAGKCGCRPCQARIAPAISAAD